MGRGPNAGNWTNPLTCIIIHLTHLSPAGLSYSFTLTPPLCVTKNKDTPTCTHWSSYHSYLDQPRSVGGMAGFVLHHPNPLLKSCPPVPLGVTGRFGARVSDRNELKEVLR